MPGLEPDEDPKAAIQADIFAFGTLLREMLNNPKIISEAKPLQNPTMDRLIASCLATDPGDRMPSMQKASLELKVATLSARHAGASIVRWRDLDAAMRAEIQESQARVEAWLEARIIEHEKNAAQKRQAASDTLNAMRLEFVTLGARLTVTHQSAEKSSERLDTLEDSLNSICQQNAALEARLSSDILRIEKDIAAHTAVVEAVRASMARTDDLVGRVVEAVQTKLAHAQESAEENEARLEVLARSVNEASQQNAALESSLAGDIQQVRNDVEAQATVMETVRASMAQTDDLVGRVVEAVEAVLDLKSPL